MKAIDRQNYNIMNQRKNNFQKDKNVKTMEKSFSLWGKIAHMSRKENPICKKKRDGRSFLKKEKDPYKPEQSINHRKVFYDSKNKNLLLKK